MSNKISRLETFSDKITSRVKELGFKEEDFTVDYAIYSHEVDIFFKTSIYFDRKEPEEKLFSDIDNSLNSFFTENNIFRKVETEYIDKLDLLEQENAALKKENERLKRYENFASVSKEISNNLCNSCGGNYGKCSCD